MTPRTIQISASMPACINFRLAVKAGHDVHNPNLHSPCDVGHAIHLIAPLTCSITRLNHCCCYLLVGDPSVMSATCIWHDATTPASNHISLFKCIKCVWTVRCLCMQCIHLIVHFYCTTACMSFLQSFVWGKDPAQPSTWCHIPPDCLLHMDYLPAGQAVSDRELLVAFICPSRHYCIVPAMCSNHIRDIEGGAGGDLLAQRLSRLEQPQTCKLAGCVELTESVVAHLC